LEKTRKDVDEKYQIEKKEVKEMATKLYATWKEIEEIRKK
jgi:hypothetical protein